MLRTPQFYVLYVMFVMMATGGLLVTAQAGPMAQSWGITRGGADAGDVAQPARQRRRAAIFWGWVSDRIGRELTMGDRVRAAGGLPAARR